MRTVHARRCGSLVATFLLMLGAHAAALATPTLDSAGKKAVGGGIVEQVRPMKTAQGEFFLVLHRPYVDGTRSLTLLRRFAGSYDRVFTTDNVEREDTEPAFDLVDSDGNGVPEVYWVFTTAASIFLMEWHNLYEPVTRTTIQVQVTFTGSYPADVSVDPLLDDPKAMAFRRTLEGKVARSPYLNDPRTAEQKVRDEWAEEWHARHGKLGTRAGHDPSIILSRMEAPLNDVRCRVPKAPASERVVLAGREYHRVTDYGVLELDSKRGVCTLILGGGPFFSPGLRVVNGLLVMEQNNMGWVSTWTFHPTTRQLSITQAMKNSW